MNDLAWLSSPIKQKVIKLKAHTLQTSWDIPALVHYS